MALLAFPSFGRWRNLPIERRGSVIRLQIIDDKENFGIKMNVNHFKPEELSVKMEDGTLLVEGHHQERNDQHGSVERHFIRKYTILETVLQDSLKSQLSDQGVLQITAEKKAIEESSRFKNIPIQFNSMKNQE